MTVADVRSVYRLFQILRPTYVLKGSIIFLWGFSSEGDSDREFDILMALSGTKNGTMWIKDHSKQEKKAIQLWTRMVE